MNNCMGFIVVEEWGDKDNPYKYHWVQVSAQVFETREEADEDAGERRPVHDDGLIRVRQELRDRPTPKRKGGRKKPRPRDLRRR